MSTALSKRQQQRNERILQDLIKVPGNDRCADCGGRNPTWASWNLGIFLCMGCASLHRKLGTHLSKVKSTTLDSWSNDQIENMRKIGNVNSNAYWNPDIRRHPPPVDVEDSSSSMERFIRDKYQYGHFKADEKKTGAPVVSPTTKVNGQDVPMGLSLNTTVKFVSQPSKRSMIAEKKSAASYARDQSHSNSNGNKANGSPTSKVLQILGVQPVHSEPQKPGISFSSSPTPLSSRSRDDLDDKLKQLRDMGFGNDKRNTDLLRANNGDMVATVETLVRLDGSLPQTPASATTPSIQSPQSAMFGQTLNVNNPFGAPQSAPIDGFGMANRNMSMPALHPMQTGQQQQAGLQLFPHRTGASFGSDQGIAQPMSAGNNPYLQQQQQPQQQQQMAYMQQQFTGLSVNTQYQQNGNMIQGPLSAPILGMQSNPFFPQQQQQIQQPQPSPAYNPFMNGVPAQQQPQSANGLAPLLQQVSLSTQYTPPGQFAPSPQPQQQQQYILQAQPQSATFPQQQQQQQQPFMYSPSPLAPQTTSSSTSSRLDKTTLLALYSQSTMLPTPPPSQPSTGTPSLASPMQQQQVDIQTTAAHSNNPFLPANAARLKGVAGGKHASQESVDFGGWKSGRHSPDAFASLSFRQ